MGRALHSPSMAPSLDRRTLIHRSTLEPIPEQPLVNPFLVSAYFLVFVCCCAAALLALNAGHGQVGTQTETQTHSLQVAKTEERSALSWMSLPAPSTPHSSGHVASPASQQGAESSSAPLTGRQLAQQSHTVRPTWQFATGTEALEEQLDQLAIDAVERKGGNSDSSAETAAQRSSRSALLSSAQRHTVKPTWQFAMGSEALDEVRDELALIEEETGRSSVSSAEPAAGAGDSPNGAALSHDQLMKSVEQPWDMKDTLFQVEVESNPGAGAGKGGLDEQLGRPIPLRAANADTLKRNNAALDAAFNEYAKEAAVEVDQFAVKQKPVNGDYDEEAAVEVDQNAVKQKPVNSEYDEEAAFEAVGATPGKAHVVGRRPLKAQLPLNSRKLGVADATQRGSRNERDAAWSEMLYKASAGVVGLNGPQAAVVMVRQGALRLLEKLVLALWQRTGGLGEDSVEEGLGPASTILAADSEALEGEFEWQDVAPKETGKTVNWVLGSLADSVGNALDEAKQASASGAGTIEAAEESALQGQDVVHLDQELAQDFV